jgi:glycerol-3-phosphate acyltransferase PlsY
MINRWIINFDQISLFRIILWTLFAYLSGSIPFSFLLTKYFSRADIHQYGDSNPGAHNAWAIGGWKVGVPAVALDVGKGAIPVILAQQIGGISAWELAPVALAAVLGHAFSPFLHFTKQRLLPLHWAFGSA